ncbi:MAG: hypothetical protein ACLFQT_09505 [Thiohalophilus sp.]
MARDNESLEQSIEALQDLVRLLQLSHDAALRLKQNVPGQDFPTAYKLARKLRVLQDAVDTMQTRLDPQAGTVTDTKLPDDLISSSDRL